MRARVFAPRSSARARAIVRKPQAPRASIRRSPGGADLRRIVQGPGPAVTPDVESYVSGLDSRGQALAPSLRADMEPRFGTDFGAVRVHTDADAAGSASALDARAYALGNHLVFGAGQYAPDTASGRRLIAHELAHTVQQASGHAAPAVQRVVGGDAKKAAVSEAWARDLNNSELPAQIDLLEKQLKTLKAGSRDYKRTEANLKILKAEQTRRNLPLPAAAKPLKDEKPAGTFTPDSTGKAEDLYQSRVPDSPLMMWWFNGATPGAAAFYPSERQLNVASLGTGQFDVAVTKGADKLGLVAAGGTAAKLSGKDLQLVTLRAKGASKSKGDVEVKISLTSPDGKSKKEKALALEVNAPARLELLKPEDTASGANGYKTVFWLRVFDNFGNPLPYLDVNEDFTVGKLEKGVSAHWEAALKERRKGATITAGNAIFTDHYTGQADGVDKDMKPVPVPPQKPLGQTLVGEFQHWWYAGTKTTGKGVHISTHEGLFFADHGEYTKLKSPP